ncbi:LysR substrate-binding domain-containing protein [Roseibium aggregatum]|uniref:LysR family transcriptional regulator n=1 Tax=Roseibium aggregatum TaxID=187304 RepID=A0A926NX73_9HYPH|nr:LysR substrate-binding domain-containing protein [Roseibium aggregatum]MBD1544873.1 LysR family transcriptional regulator [Roseibium aggregatum]
MSRFRKNLPPLDALVFLESAGRLQSFTAAARELNVSQAAVSKRVRQLEDWLGVTLIERVGRGIRTTHEGDRLVARVGMSLDFLEETIADLRAPSRPSVRLASMTALAMFWLQPRLRDFALSDRACDIALTLSDKPSELLSGTHDLVLIYGDGRFSGWQATQIMSERLQPVCAPSLARDIDSDDGFTALKQATGLLDFPRSGPDWIDWAQWARLPGAPDIGGWQRTGCANYAHSIGLALRGEGIALGSLPLLSDEVRSGRLCTLLPEPVTTSRGYWLLHRDDGAVSDLVAGVRDFLLEEAAADR